MTVPQTFRNQPMHDSPDGMYVEVISEDIHPEWGGDPEKCAIACACRRQHNREAVIYRTVIYVKSLAGDCWYRYKLPQAAQAELKRFDQHKDFMDKLPQEVKEGIKRFDLLTSTFATGTYYLAPIPVSDRLGTRAKSRGENDHSGRGRGSPRTRRDIVGVREYSPLAGGALNR